MSPRAYRHYLDALLARGADDYPTAAQELREALLYDPESPHLHTVLAEVLLKCLPQLVVRGGGGQLRQSLDELRLGAVEIPELLCEQVIQGL